MKEVLEKSKDSSMSKKSRSRKLRRLERCSIAACRERKEGIFRRWKWTLRTKFSSKTHADQSDANEKPEHRKKKNKSSCLTSCSWRRKNSKTDGVFHTLCDMLNPYSGIIKTLRFLCYMVHTGNTPDTSIQKHIWTITFNCAWVPTKEAALCMEDKWFICCWSLRLASREL